MLFSLLAAATVGLQSNDLLPDITIWDQYLYDTSIDTTTIPGRTLLRLSTATPNLGPGRLELRGGRVIDNDHQEVNQRIYRRDGTFWERLAGVFTYHQGHAHIHFDDWCVYRLREVLPGNGVGRIIATGEKTSFCVLDLTIFDRNIEGFDENGFYRSCGRTVQGLTPGWSDIYHKGLPEQWIDITGVANGEYWLEAEVDPNQDILERSEFNNVGRVKINVGPPPPPFRDRYEDNDSRAQVDGRPEGGQDSPNLGIVNGRRVIADLSMDDDNDWFKFRLNNTGGPGDFVQISSTFGGYDTDMELFDANGSRLGSSTGSDSFEQISLNGRTAGVYYVRIYVYSGRVPRYTFTIEPAGNGVPSITVSEPAEGVTYVESSVEAFPVRWQASDPENDPMRVSLFIDRDGILDKETMPLAGYQNMPSENNGANVNTADIHHGMWHIYSQVTDGGAQIGAWAPGTVFVFVRGDADENGHVEFNDVRVAKRAIDSGQIPDRWQRTMDLDRDGDFDIVDYRLLRSRFLTGPTPRP